MAVYLLYMASPVIVALIMSLVFKMDINQSRYKKIYLLICGIIIALVIGFMHYSNGSGDAKVYYDLWEKMSNVSVNNLKETLNKMDMEQGFLICVWICSKIFVHPQFIFILCGILFSASVCHLVKNNCDNAMLGILVFNCLGMFNFMVQGMRQAIAMSICFFALEYCKNRKPIKFFIMVGIAMMFHVSAVVFVAVYVLSYFKLTIKSVTVFVITVCICILSMPVLFKLVNILMNDNYSINNTENSTGGVVAILIYCSIIVFALIVNDYKSPDKNYTLFIYMAVIAMISLILRNTVNTIIERVGMYFACSQMLLVSNSIERVKPKRLKQLALSAVVILCIGVAVYKSTYSPLVPYKFFWQ